MLEINGASTTSRVIGCTDSTCQTPDADLGEQVVEVSIVYPEGTTTTPQGVASHVNITNES